MDGERGIALPATLLLSLALYFVVAAAAHQSLSSTRIAVHHDAYQRVLAAAEGALAQGVEALVTAYEAGTAPPDTALLVADSLGRVATGARCFARREPADTDLNGNGIPNEIVLYDRAWGYPEALHAGGPIDPGEPVRIVVGSARGGSSFEEVLQEVAFERDPAVADPTASGAWHVVPLRWSGIVGHR